ncbi:MAG: response regulator [Burkholderiales bacterium]|nr:response regulator [Burkholderiales bacterium]MDE2455356.1 response regulator [Burkholderiales bacterium]
MNAAPTLLRSAPRLPGAPAAALIAGWTHRLRERLFGKGAPEPRHDTAPTPIEPTPSIEPVRVGRAGPASGREPAQAVSGRLQGRVLLVEDDFTNQAVALAILDDLGLDGSLAVNGVEAVQRVAHSEFDLVLMDCRMPVMNGLQATAAIRRLPEGRGSALPIVALTANAMRGDEQACLEAGMNGFVAKPYSRAALAAQLGQWLEADGAAFVDSWLHAQP